jgi:DNA-binding response OmpR family regulator
MSNVLLIVEDDDDICEALQVVLESRGHVTVCAPDGVEALRWLKAHGGASLVLLDLLLPRLNGEELLRAMRSDPALANIPVVILSGDAGARAIAGELHAQECLQKPVDLDRLLGAVKAHISHTL